MKIKIIDLLNKIANENECWKGKRNKTGGYSWRFVNE